MGLNIHTQFQHKLRRSMKELKGSRVNRPCVIMGLAPHLDDMDLSILDGLCEVFVCNRFYRCFDDPPFNPMYYMCADRRVWRREAERVVSENVILILGDVLFDRNCALHDWIPNGRMDDKGRGACPPPNVSWYGYRTIHHTDQVKFGDDPDHGFWQAGTVVYDMLQAAHYMGYDPIGIVGVDLLWPNDSKSPTHAGGMDGREHEAFPLYTDYNLKYFRNFGVKLDGLGTKVYNLAPGGALDCFERTSLEAFAYQCDLRPA